jgi:hypothetical protein
MFSYQPKNRLIVKARINDTNDEEVVTIHVTEWTPQNKYTIQ